MGLTVAAGAAFPADGSFTCLLSALDKLRRSRSAPGDESHNASSLLLEMILFNHSVSNLVCYY